MRLTLGNAWAGKVRRATVWKCLTCIILVGAVTATAIARRMERVSVVPSWNTGEASRDLADPSAGDAVHDWTRDSELARAWLIAGRSRSAVEILEKAWKSQHHPGWSRGRLAVYIGLCCQQSGESELAHSWLQRAAQEGIAEFRGDAAISGDAGEFFDSIGYGQLPNAPVDGQGFRFVSQVSQDHAASLHEAVDKLRSAHRSYDEKNLDGKIRYATWLLLVGELASTWDELCLSSNAVEATERGKELLAQISSELNKNPELQRQLDQNPPLAIRFDAALARQNVVNQKDALARDKERARLNQLRTLARSYRTVIEAMGIGELNMLLGDAAELRNAQQQVLKELVNVESVATARKDLYLFSDEPNLTEGADFELVKIAPRPYTESLVSFHKALHALSILQFAEQSSENREPALTEARNWAAAALKEEAQIPGAPAGSDQGNIIATYVQLAASDALGLLAASSADKGTRTKANEEFIRARDGVAQLKQQLAAVPAGDNRFSSKFQGRAQELIGKVSGDDSIKNRSLALRDAGRGAEARQELLDGAKRNRSEALAISYIQLGRRLGVSLDQARAELANLQNLELISPSSAWFALEVSRLNLAEIGRKIATDGVPIPPSPECTRLHERLAAQENYLRKVLPGDMPNPLRAQLEAQLALTLAYSLATTQTRDVATTVRESVQLARNASVVLDGSSKDGAVTADDKSSYHDSLVTARLALGYSALIGLPGHRDEGITAFTAALDDAVQSEGTMIPVALLGSPLIRALTSRDENNNARLAVEERSRRQLMTRFVEATLTSQFGEPEAAAKQLTDALTQLNASGRPGGALKADVVLRDSDGFDAERDMRNNARSIQVLSEVKSGLAGKAMLHAMDLANVPIASEAQLADRLGQAKADASVVAGVDRLQSPLSLAAVALAAEAYATAIPLSRQDQTRVRENALELARRASSKALTVLAAPQLAQRYPHLQSLAQATHGRLASPDKYLEQLRQLQSQGKFDEAIAACESGLQRHSNAAALWRSLVELQIEKLRYSKPTESKLREVLTLVGAAASKKNISEHERAFAEGIIYEQLGDSVTAMARYEAAVKSASAGSERVRALAKASALRARQSYVSR